MPDIHKSFIYKGSGKLKGIKSEFEGRVYGKQTKVSRNNSESHMLNLPHRAGQGRRLERKLMSFRRRYVEP